MTPRPLGDYCAGSGEPCQEIDSAPLLSGDVVLRYGRGTCPACMQDRALNADGTVRRHTERIT